MSRWIKRSSLWRGKWCLRAGVLCCALLIPLSISTNVLCAAPLTRVSPPGDLSDAWKHKWLAGVMIYTVSPPEGLSKTQELEWSIGTIAASAELCGYYEKVSKVEAIMKKSIYFKRGYEEVMNFFDFAQNCSQYDTFLDTVLGEKEEWENYLGVTHGTASEPEKNVLEQRLQQARAFNGRNDEEICKRALSGDREKPNWDNKTFGVNMLMKPSDAISPLNTALNYWDGIPQRLRRNHLRMEMLTSV